MNSMVSAPAEAADAAEAGLASIVPSPLRADLKIQRQLFRGNEYYVIKDPLSLTYFRLRSEEGYLIMQFDGKRTLGDVLNGFRKVFPQSSLSAQELGAFINQMGSAGLLNINARRFVSVARAYQSLPRSWLMMWGKLISGLLFMRFPLVDPSPWLGGLTRAIRFIWTRWFIGSCCAFILWSVFWLVVNRDAFAQNTVNFFSSENLILVWVTIILVKTLHEFGHATTCCHFGGEVHEMGVCLICFTPAGYVDASDAWMMRETRHKLYTTMAGVFTEFVIAGIAAHLWLYLPAGIGKNLAFNAMIVASVNTVFFNANPLMKFDGYYVVCDLLEIPNLRAKAMTFCSYHIQRLLLGYRNLLQERALGDDHQGGVFIGYSILAYLYMMTVIYGLTQVFARVLAPYGLYDFGLLVGIFVEGSFVMFPIVKVLSDAFAAGSANIIREERASRRILRWAVPTAVLSTILASIPTHYSLEQQAVVVAARSELAGVEVGGTVREIHVRSGEWVEEGAPLLTLANEEVDAEVRMAELTFEAAKLRLASLHSDGSLRTKSLAPEAALAVDTTATSLDRARRAQQQLVVRAPVAGFVTTPDLERMQGQYLRPGFSGLRVADQKHFKLLIPLKESEAELVEVGSPVMGRFRSSATALDARITVLPTQRAMWQDYHPAMLAAFGGPAPFEQTMPSARTAPSYGLYLAEADLPEMPPLTAEGMRVMVTIKGRSATYGQKLWRWAAGLWHPRSS